jgi:hypothetical protein
VIGQVCSSFVEKGAIVFLNDSWLFTNGLFTSTDEAKKKAKATTQQQQQQQHHRACEYHVRVKIENCLHFT